MRVLKKYQIKSLVNRLPQHGVGQLATQGLAQQDPEMFKIFQGEIGRQNSTINLIPHENYPGLAVTQQVGSVLQAKYSEGYPGARYYGGTEWMDASDNLCTKRLLSLFGLGKDAWDVNLQALSGSLANFAVAIGLCPPHGRIMTLDPAHGGSEFLANTQQKTKSTAISKYYDVLHYGVKENGEIDYDQLESSAKQYSPFVIFGGSAGNNQDVDWKRLRDICNKSRSALVAHISNNVGLIISKQLNNPFEYADVVTFSSSGSFRGPKGAVTLYKIGSRGKNAKGIETFYDYKQAIDGAIFPGLQGGPHNHAIAGISIAAKLAHTPEYKEYVEQSIRNIKVLEEGLRKVVKLNYAPTKNHTLSFQLSERFYAAQNLQKFLEEVGVDTVIGSGGGKLRTSLNIGSQAMTTRGLGESEFKQISEIVTQTVELYRQSGALPTLTEQLNHLRSQEQFKSLTQQVYSLSQQYPIPPSIFDA